MKIVSSIYNLKQLNNNIKYMDAALIMVPNLALVYDDIDIDAAIDICKRNNVMPILAINKIFQPSEMSKCEELLLKYKNDSLIYFYITDIGLANIGIKNNIINRMIFNPETMITNYLDLIEYSSLGFDAVSMSLEITLNDLMKSYDETNANLFYLGFGHRLMFYSKRHLITLYGNKNEKNYPLNDLYLRESTREDYFPVIENNNGTIVYRSYLISLLEHLNDISFLKYLYCDSLYINDETYSIALKAYYEAANDVISLAEAKNIIDSLSLDIKDGFKYKDSVYQKEELKQ